MSEEIYNDYSKSVIYTIYNENHPELIYVGSTTNLNNRIPAHYYKCKKYPNRLVYKTINNNWTDWKFKIYEEYPCNNRKDLEKREGVIIKLIGTLNERIAGRNNKEYYETYRDKRIQQMNIRYIKNKDKQSQYYKERYLKNKLQSLNDSDKFSQLVSQ